MRVLCALCRAEKFGVPYVEPGKRRDLRLDARKERLARPGFATGIGALRLCRTPCLPASVGRVVCIIRIPDQLRRIRFFL